MSAVELTLGLTLYDVIPGPLPVAPLYKLEPPTKGIEWQRNAERASGRKTAERFTKSLFTHYSALSGSPLCSHLQRAEANPASRTNLSPELFPLSLVTSAAFPPQGFLLFRDESGMRLPACGAAQKRSHFIILVLSFIITACMVCGQTCQVRGWLCGAGSLPAPSREFWGSHSGCPA